MRRPIVLFALSAMLLLAAFIGPSAHAQQSSTSLSPGQQVLTPYLLTRSAIPAALQQQDVMPLSNVLVGAFAQDPVDIQKVLDRARIDGLEQDFGQLNGNSAQIQLQLSLFRDKVGADTDVGDPILLSGLRLTSVGVPLLGDVSAGYLTKSASFESTNIAFASDRLQVLISEVGTPGSTSMADVLPLATLMASRTKLPPPPPSPDELAVLMTQTSPESILRDAYTLLYENYLEKFPPSQYLGPAFDAASQALTDAGVTGLPASPSITSSDEDGAWGQFLPAYQQLEQLTPSTISQSALAYDAATAMYGDLNCHTSFFTPKDYQREVQDLSGSAEARIGILIQKFPNAQYTILRVQSSSPAEQAGLKAGDEITAIDHQTPEQLGDHFADLFIGAAGTPITLTIQRVGTSQSFDVTIIRQLIPTTVEQHQILPGGVGYIEFDDFTDGDVAYNDVQKALQDFQAAGNVNSWIMDLRYNSGGSEATMDRIAGLFVPSGSLLTTETQQDGSMSQTTAVGPEFPTQKSMVLIIGANTASAAEIFTQSMKDLGRVTLVGETTAGCVNGGLPLGLLDGSGIFVSTILVLSGPGKVAIEKVGVTPDDMVDLTLQDVQNGQDPQLAAAVSLFTGTQPSTLSRAIASLRAHSGSDGPNDERLLWR